jgi:hypothetical protein
MSAYHREFEDTQSFPVMPAEASTELGFERSPAPRIPRRERMGSVGRRQCWLIKHGAVVTAAIALGSFALIGWLR